jgi:hypothetical protein
VVVLSLRVISVAKRVPLELHGVGEEINMDGYAVQMMQGDKNKCRELL